MLAVAAGRIYRLSRHLAAAAHHCLITCRSCANDANSLDWHGGALTVILLSRITPDIAIQEDLRRIGNSHNSDDPFFTALKQRTLKQYGVEKIEDLPVTYGGSLAVEGEKLTSKLFDNYAD